MSELLNKIVDEAARLIGRVGFGFQIQFGMNPDCREHEKCEQEFPSAEFLDDEAGRGDN
jgi:hypothetical protein